ncbi:glyoxylate/hydroxypyruvate reductase GhrA [Pantoea sp. 1.19]|uniref:glyoxylate/hydroxypyruvate reductase GhrA n=1 Tax=Pantoea sp. 1.19 TaxID=1925589 RepID=UPI000948FA5F|nr:glyoxylate/hydroxypyruvate reductase GhrA [Pantoea sp. 1.19]
MELIFYHPFFNSDRWITGLQTRLPGSQVRVWQPGDDAPADYALVRTPPPEMLRGRQGLKGVFALGAGVDDILDQLRTCPDMLDPAVPLFRLEDTGMSLQMQEYAVQRVLGWFRRFDEYQQLQAQGRWQPLKPHRRESFTVGVLGAGVLGQAVASSLKAWGFPLRLWSRSPREWAGMQTFHGREQLPAFLAGTQVLINLLPATAETEGIINRAMLRQLNPQAYLLNLARGVHVVEADLLAALAAGELQAAALDVFNVEPLPEDHPFWHHPRIAITPHNAAVTLPEEAMAYIARAIGEYEAGKMPAGWVDRQRGY